MKKVLFVAISLLFIVACSKHSSKSASQPQPIKKSNPKTSQQTNHNVGDARMPANTSFCQLFYRSVEQCQADRNLLRKYSINFRKYALNKFKTTRNRQDASMALIDMEKFCDESSTVGKSIDGCLISPRESLILGSGELYNSDSDYDHMRAECVNAPLALDGPELSSACREILKVLDKKLPLLSEY